jgi:hypothetical protein
VYGPDGTHHLPAVPSWSPLANSVFEMNMPKPSVSISKSGAPPSTRQMVTPWNASGVATRRPSGEKDGIPKPLVHGAVFDHSHLRFEKF